MGQQDISKILEKNGGWMTIKQISEELNQAPALISQTLLKMSCWVLRKEILAKRNGGRRKVLRFKLK